MRIARLMALVLWCVAGSLAVTAQPASLKLVSSARPPFTNVPGAPRLALDLIETALNRVGIRATTSIVPPADYTTSLLTGPYDGSASAWKDAERERVLLFSNPYIENRMVLVGRRGSSVSAKTLTELKGRKIAIVGGFSYGDAIDLSGPAFVRSTSEEDSLTRLLQGSVDYTLMDELVVDVIASSYPKESAAKLQLGSTPLLTRPMHLAIRRTRPDAAAIIAGFNAQIRAMIADKTYHKLLHQEWIRADVNGDGVPEFVPVTDEAGQFEPKLAYSLSSTTPVSGPEVEIKSGFYLGGNVYEDWASVPDSYKRTHSKTENPERTTASIFNFTW
jgi:polar amino acid transport system substrate-binding protein